MDNEKKRRRRTPQSVPLPEEPKAQPAAPQAQEPASVVSRSAQDSHGAASRRRAAEEARRIRRPSRRSSRVYRQIRWSPRLAWEHPPQMNPRLLAMAILAIIALVSACMAGGIVLRMIRTRATNAELVAIVDEAQRQPEQEIVIFTAAPQETPEPTPAPQATREPEKTNAPDAAAQPKATDAPKRVFHQVGGEALPHMAQLHAKNHDLVGWLSIDNVLDLPVVYRDNDYYLRRDFYKKPNTAGTIFLDENHPFREKTQNLLLHGHNMKDGTMFGRLVQYETDLDYVRWHPFIRFDTLWRREEYVIFAVLRVSLDAFSEDYFDYFTHPSFASDAQARAYIRALQLRSLYAIPIDVQPSDALLTLSTCLDDDRLVIVARRVREGETHAEIREITYTTSRQ